MSDVFKALDSIAMAVKTTKKYCYFGVREMGQFVRVLAAFAENLSSDTSIHVEQVTTTFYSISK